MLISICIPAYKRSSFLKRLLDSIAVQTFRDFEVIITDDSPDDEVKNIAQQYSSQFLLHYQKNNQPLGTPENWNESIRLAKGDWIKVMHDDDWFVTSQSLGKFADAINNNPEKTLIFSAFNNVDEGSKKTKTVVANYIQLKSILKNPSRLIANNIIGPPSTTVFKNSKLLWFDKTLKWLVDIEFYIQAVEVGKSLFITEPLINIGVSETQVTKSAFRNPGVEIPEHLYLLNKIGVSILRDPLVFDAYWRLFRNLKINSADDIRSTGYAGTIPIPVLKMIRIKKMIPFAVLKLGLVSKSIMIATYFLQRRSIHD